MQVRMVNLHEVRSHIYKRSIINALPEGTLRRRNIQSNKPANADSGKAFFNSERVLS